MSNTRYKIERDCFGCVLIEEKSNLKGKTERRLPYSLRTEAYSCSILNSIHDGVLTDSVQEIRSKRAKSLACFIEEAFCNNVPNIEKFSILKEKIELLLDATIAELRPNSSPAVWNENLNTLENI